MPGMEETYPCYNMKPGHYIGNSNIYTNSHNNVFFAIYIIMSIALLMASSKFTPYFEASLWENTRLVAEETVKSLQRRLGDYNETWAMF